MRFSFSFPFLLLFFPKFIHFYGKKANDSFHFILNLLRNVLKIFEIEICIYIKFREGNCLDWYVENPLSCQYAMMFCMLSGVRSSQSEGGQHFMSYRCWKSPLGIRAVILYVFPVYAMILIKPGRAPNWHCNLSIWLEWNLSRLILLQATKEALLFSLSLCSRPTALAASPTLSSCNNLTFSSLNESSEESMESCLGDGFAFNIALNAVEIWLQFDTFVGCKRVDWQTDRIALSPSPSPSLISVNQWRKYHHQLPSGGVNYGSYVTALMRL